MPDASLPSPFSAAEYLSRRQRLIEGMRAAAIDCAAIIAPADLVYLTGLDLASQLVVNAGGDAVHLVQINFERARVTSPIQDVRTSRGVRSLVDVLLDICPSGGTIGLPFDVLPHRQFAVMAERLLNRRLVDVSALVLDIRRRKSARELEVLRQAASISAAGFARAREFVRSGCAEYELQLAMEGVERGLGADGVMRHRGWRAALPWGIVCSGPGTTAVSGHWLTQTGQGPSSARPYSAGRRRMRVGELVVVDRGVVLHGYHCDEARTMVVGRATARQRRCWESLRRIMAAAVGAVQPGAAVRSVYDAALAAAKAEGLGEVFMTRAMGGVEYIGHGVGLEIDEPPLIGPGARETIELGMVLALEPKIIVPGWGGMTLEETVAVTREGGEVITQAPIEPLAVIT